MYFCMYVCIYVYGTMYAYMYVIYVCLYTYIQCHSCMYVIFMHIYMHTDIHTHYKCISTCIHKWMHACIHTYIHACIILHIYTQMYTCIHMHPYIGYTHVYIHMFLQGLLSEFFLSGRLCPDGFCPFPLLSEYIRYNRKLNINFNFRFLMQDKKTLKVWRHMILYYQISVQ